MQNCSPVTTGGRLPLALDIFSKHVGLSTPVDSFSALTSKNKHNRSKRNMLIPHWILSNCVQALPYVNFLRQIMQVSPFMARLETVFVLCQHFWTGSGVHSSFYLTSTSKESRSGQLTAYMRIWSFTSSLHFHFHGRYDVVFMVVFLLRRRSNGLAVKLAFWLAYGLRLLGSWAWIFLGCGNTDVILPLVFSYLRRQT